ncbi:MAG: ABC transporter ATP-binding protein, partial [Chloroflexota bacterium]|nr:ABC transporter ATP-binding protein [Chloroflexota bacterium]
MSGPMGGRPPMAGRSGAGGGSGGPPAGPRGPRGGPMAMMMGGPPPEKSKNFGQSFRRLLSRLRPERALIALVVALCAISVLFQVVGPKILGNATNIIFAGVIGQQLPAGMTQLQVEALLRTRGQDQFADML